MAERDESIRENFVIIGGGAAGYAAAQAMREADFMGKDYHCYKRKSNSL